MWIFLREMTIDCRPELSAYLSELLAARDALNVVGPASMRLACSLTADGLLKAARTVSRDKVWDVANYAQVRQVTGIQAALAAAPDRNDPIAMTRFAILQTGLGLEPCPPGSLSSSNLESTPVLQLELLLRSCKAARVAFMLASNSIKSESS
jgi:hypothetical protein